MAGTHVGANLVPFRLSRHIYRDRTHLRAGPLKAEIKEAVCASKFLIVCCSAHSSQSKWVQEEINLFLQARPEAKAKILLCRVGSKEGSDAESLTPIAQLVGNESFVPDVRGYAPTATRKELRAFHFEALSLLAPLLQLPDKQAVAAVIRRRLVSLRLFSWLVRWWLRPFGPCFAGPPPVPCSS